MTNPTRSYPYRYQAGVASIDELEAALVKRPSVPGVPSEVRNGVEGLIEIARAAVALVNNATLFSTNEGWLSDRQDLAIAVERYAIATTHKGNRP